MNLDTVNMPKIDVALKNYFEDDDIFASVFNSFLFGKKEYIDPKSLKRDNTVYAESVKGNRQVDAVSRYRDIIRFTCEGTLIILGLENQDKIHYAMPIRKMLYDALEYVKQISELKYDKNEMRKWTADERLGRVKKGTKLIPVITVVFYTGEKEWDGPRSLYDMLDIDDEIRHALPDYPLHIIDLGHDKLSFTNEDLEELKDIVSDIYAKRLDRETLVDSKNLSMAGILVGDKGLYVSAQKKEGKKPMCNALKERDAIIFAEKEAEIVSIKAEKEAKLQEKDAEIVSLRAEKDAEIVSIKAEKDAEIEKLKAMLKDNNIALD